MPEISKFFGIIIKMYFNEQSPPHFHVEYKDNAAIINIEDGTVKGEMPMKQINLIFQWIDLYKSELLNHWELSNARQPLLKINLLNKEI